MRGSRSIELARLKKEEEERKKKEKHLVRFASSWFGTFARFSPAAVSVVGPYKLEDEWYVVIKGYKLTVFEILRDFLYCHILRVRAIPTLESTDSMIVLP